MTGRAGWQSIPEVPEVKEERQWEWYLLICRRIVLHQFGIMLISRNWSGCLPATRLQVASRSWPH